MTGAPALQVKFLSLAIGLVALASIGFPADFGKVTMSRVAEGIYLFTTSRYGDVGFGGNSVAILTDDGVVMFDTSGTPASGQAILSEVHKLTHKPVLFVINSHWHWDHWGGNQVFKAAFPTVQFLSHETNRDQMINVAVPWNAPGLERDLPNYIERQKQQLAASQANHTPEADLASRRELLAADEDFLRQKRSVTYTFPTVTFGESATLYVGGRELRVLHARAITPGDTYVYLPGDKILITGDILVSPVPFAVGGTYPQEWIATLERLNSFESSIIIPGHGDVERDKTYLHQNLRLFQHLLADVKDAKEKGATLEQTMTLLLNDALRYTVDLGLPDRRLAEFKSYFLEVFVNRAYRELEKPLGDKPTT
ncbi:MAG TPA: MBL fold metallo-hydrolase [Vicinamibacteria bacterium]|nr:MBL fold metallo-hydrolase [Vicinamibacteria bacterium]